MVGGDLEAELGVAAGELFAVEASGEPVIQPSINWEISDKWSTNLWASSDVDEVFTDPFGNAGSEVDLTATYQATDTTSFTAGRYFYPAFGWETGDWMAEVNTSAAGLDFTVSGYWGTSDTMVFTAKKPLKIGSVDLNPGLSYKTRAGRFIGHITGSVPIGDSGATIGGLVSSSEGETFGALKLSVPIGNN